MSDTPDDHTDALAHAVHTLVTETADRQVSREIAHMAEIEVDSHGAHAVSPPAGYRPLSNGVLTTHVIATSRDVPDASTEMRVAVWASEPGTTPNGFLLTRGDSDRSLVIDTNDIDPEPTDHLRGQVNDFVALIIAHMVSELSSAMQRAYVRESSADVAEYDGT